MKTPAFPFATVRAGQDTLLRDIDGAIESGLTLLCSAPTGIGKTAAALYPALCRALAEDRRVFFATAKNSQQELALETLRAMLPDGGLAVQIRAKDRICPNDGVRCREPRCRYQERFRERLEKSDLLQELAETRVVDAATIEARALARRLCPFEVSLALAEDAHVVVLDYNYVFEPNVYVRRFFDVPYDGDILIVDEAHNLPARAGGYYSPELDLGHLERLGAQCLAQGGGPFAAAGDLLLELADELAATARHLAEERSHEPPWVETPDRSLCEHFGPRVDPALSAYQSYLSAGGRRPAPFEPVVEAARQRARDPLLAALYTLRDFFRGPAADPDRFAALYSAGRVKLLCVDPAPFLRERVRGFHAAVFMSATLVPLEFYARRLGVDGPDTVALDLPSPFPRQNRLLLSVSSVDTTYRKRSEHADRIAQLMADTMALRSGNYLAFFPSFAYRDEVIAKLPRSRARVLLQLPGMPAELTLPLLRRPGAETHLLCAVQGGIFAEGVDYPGDMAIGVFVIGPGLPAVSPEQELTRSYFDGELGAGFEYAYVYPGLNRAVQAGGRALRSEHDCAFTMLFGRRFSERLYRSRLPAFWQDELIDCEEPAEQVAAFWARVAPGA